MRKLPPRHDPPPRTAGRARRRLILALALGLGLAPVVSESAQLCAARWAAMYGSVREVDTPVLDRLHRWYDGVVGSADAASRRMFQALPWQPSLVIPIAAAWAALGALLMRRR